MKRIWGNKGFLFILLSPTLFIFFLFEIYPFLYGLFLTFSNKKYYTYVLGDPNLLLSFKISLLYSILSISLTFFLGFLFAITFERKLTFKPIYEILFFIPWAIPKYIFILAFRALLHGYNGNSLFNTLFGTGFNLVNSTFYSWVAILIVSVILSLPFTTLIIQNALRGTDKELKYVSYIDGATPLEYYINIALPEMYPTIVPFITLEFIKAFKVFNAVYLLTQGGPPLLEGFGDKSIIGSTTTLTLLAYSIFAEGDDPVIGVGYSTVVGVIVLFFLLLLFFSFHITRRYRKYKGIFIVAPFLFHALGLIPGLGFGLWELALFGIYVPSLYLYIKRDFRFRKTFGYAFLIDLVVNIVSMGIKGSPFSFSIGTVFTFFMFLFVRPDITVWRRKDMDYREFYNKMSYWFSVVIAAGLAILQEKFLKGISLFVIPYLMKLEEMLKYTVLLVLIFSLFTTKGYGAKGIVMLLILFVLSSFRARYERNNHPLFHIFLSIYLFILILPIYNILWISLSGENTLLITSFLPRYITFSNFSRIVREEHFLLFIKNSLAVSGITFLLVSILSLGPALYISRRKGFGGTILKNTMIYISSFTGIYTLLPLYIIFRSLHLLNNISALSFVFLVNTLPMAILTVSGAISNLPSSYEEAASLDGATPWQIVFHILFPLIKPSLIVSGILGFMGAWGGFFAPLIFINDTSKYTIPVKLYYYVGEIGSQYPSWTLFSAGAVLSAIPVLFLFYFTRNFRKNL